MFDKIKTPDLLRKSNAKVGGLKPAEVTFDTALQALATLGLAYATAGLVSAGKPTLFYSEKQALFIATFRRFEEGFQETEPTAADLETFYEQMQPQELEEIKTNAKVIFKEIIRLSQLRLRKVNLLSLLEQY